MESTFSDPTTQHLAEIFERHLDLGDHIRTEDPISSLQSDRTYQQESIPIKYSVSQHYTHSAHVATSSLHPLQPHRDDQTSRLLIQNDIAPSSLLRSQLELFERSNTDERAKLVMLWRLAPPMYARHGGQDLADKTGQYQHVTLAQEEELAWMRYQRHHTQGDVEADTQAEQICGRQSVLGPFFQSPYMPQDPQSTAFSGSLGSNETERTIEDHEML